MCDGFLTSRISEDDLAWFLREKVLNDKLMIIMNTVVSFCPTSVSRFLQACRANACEISEDEIVDDVRQIRYQKA